MKEKLSVSLLIECHCKSLLAKAVTLFSDGYKTTWCHLALHVTEMTGVKNDIILTALGYASERGQE